MDSRSLKNLRGNLSRFRRGKVLSPKTDWPLTIPCTQRLKRIMLLQCDASFFLHVFEQMTFRHRKQMDEDPA